MITNKQIRADLKEIRYYYSMKDLVDLGAKTVKPNALYQKVDLYSKAVSAAPARLYVVYISLYVYNNSITALAEDWCFTREYVGQLNRKLVAFLQSKIEELIKE